MTEIRYSTCLFFLCGKCRDEYEVALRDRYEERLADIMRDASHVKSPGELQSMLGSPLNGANPNVVVWYSGVKVF
jgi:hypothetical protein